MTPTEYREALRELGLSIIGAGPVLGVHPRTSQHYADLSGDGPPETVAILLRLLIDRQSK